MKWFIFKEQFYLMLLYIFIVFSDDVIWWGIV